MSETQHPPRDWPRARAARQALLDAALPEAAFEGWNEAVLKRAAGMAGLTEGEVELYCPGGVLDLLETWSRNGDAGARTLIEAEPRPNRIRDKVARAVMIRLDQYAGQEEAAARARARLLLPDGLERGTRLLWATSDTIWRAIGDTSTDGNFYSKRAILSGVYASTLAIWLDETDPDKPKTRDFLDRRIENVMQFEKAKAQWRKATANLPSLSGLAARLRYGPGRQV
ncbi:COQ9 family protein [Marinicauda algicola]|uniref:COQ9 family protein n=1 Tax=Marinicauda algicola TaxID=2029849 RepID=A0A4S2H4Q6_9PROT|nr:COQ9 family protein [Marinicauda algicola]TGY90523.1 COQ9 family protein [Marinicauda algicola]